MVILQYCITTYRCPFLIANFFTRPFIYTKCFVSNFNHARVRVQHALHVLCVSCHAILNNHWLRLWKRVYICFGDVADRNIATILLILGSDSYRAWFSNAFVRSWWGVKKHSQTFASTRGRHPMKVLKPEAFGLSALVFSTSIETC